MYVGSTVNGECRFVRLPGTRNKKTDDRTDTPQNDNADSNANGSDNEPAQNTSKFTLKQVEFNAKGHFEFVGDSDYGRFRYNDKYGIIDIDGNIVIEPIYEDMSFPSENLVVAETSEGDTLLALVFGVDAHDTAMKSYPKQAVLIT